MVNLIIQIDGQDRTNRVQYQSLRINDNINQRRDTCVFQIKKAPNQTFVPEVNQEVVILDGATRIFGGIITNVDIKVQSVNHIIYDVNCVDYSFLLDRRLVLDRFRNQTVGFIVDFLLNKYDVEGFTMNNVVGSTQINSITFNRITFSECLEKLAEVTGYSWYVDYNKDIHFFPRNTELSPFNLTDTSNNYIWESLEVKNDITQLRNAVYIEGGEERGNERTEEFTASGDETERTYFRLAHKFAELPMVEVNNVVQTVGVEFLNDDSDFDCMWSFQEKYIRFTAGNQPEEDDLVEVTGIPLFPIIVRVQSSVSIGQYGLYEYVIRDRTIQSREEAKLRAQSELRAYQNGLVEGGFRTYNKGLRSGQVIGINSNLRSVNESFVIQKVSFSMRTQDQGVWSITLATLRSVGIIDFMQNLLRNRGISEGESETLLTFIQFEDEAIGTDVLVTPFVKTSPPYIWLSDDPGEDATLITEAGMDPIIWNFWTWEDNV